MGPTIPPSILRAGPTILKAGGIVGQVLPPTLTKGLPALANSRAPVRCY